MSHLSCRVGMGGIWELLDGKIWEWALSFRWEWDRNGNELIEMGGNWYEKSVPAHLYSRQRQRCRHNYNRPIGECGQLKARNLHIKPILNFFGRLALLVAGVL